MEAAGVTAMREDEALTSLKNKLKVSPGERNVMRDSLLLRYLRNTNLDVTEAANKLARRRQFEGTFPALTVTPEVVAALQSSMLCLIGNDVLRRPVIYFRAALHKVMGSASSNHDERLLIVLMEYIQTIYIHPNYEFVLLIDEQCATLWGNHEDGLAKRLAIVLDKYYPEQVGLVLVANASAAIGKAFRAAITTLPQRIRTRIELVPNSGLTQFIAADILPSELGGRNNVAATCLPQDLCDATLRHWFALTQQLRLESSRDRSLWNAIQATDTAPLVNRQHLATRYSPLNADYGSARNRAISVGDMAGGSQCSVLSFASEDPEETNTFSDGKPPTTIVANDAAVAKEMEDLRAKLDAETRRRAELESKVEKLELGVKLDEAAVPQLEATLRLFHEEVNVLAGEIIHRTREARPGEITLQLLLEQTDAALLRTVQDRSQLQALKAAPIPTRKPPSSCCIM